MDYIDTWGLYQCFQGIDEEMITLKYGEKYFESILSFIRESKNLFIKGSELNFRNEKIDYLKE